MGEKRERSIELYEAMKKKREKDDTDSLAVTEWEGIMDELPRLELLTRTLTEEEKGFAAAITESRVESIGRDTGLSTENIKEFLKSYLHAKKTFFEFFGQRLDL